MFVTNQFFEASIKGGEREKRAATGQVRVTPNRQVESFFLFQGRKYNNSKVFKISITESKYFVIVLVFSTLLLKSL